MISPKVMYDSFAKENVTFYAGVPDSLLKDFCAFITEKNVDNHVIAVNEGSAVGLGIGHYLATGSVAVVYMQNSGLGNIVNPVLSLADKDVYSIPMILLIGWRGEMVNDATQLKDEPQHKTQGRLTTALLDAMEIPYIVIDKDTESIETVLSECVEKTKSIGSPVAILVRKGTFEKYTMESISSGYTMTREMAIEYMVDSFNETDVVVGTTGMASRELFEIRKKKGHPHTDFLCVGGMGHASSIAVGVAHANTGKNVWCLDGDGALLMHMGALAVNKQYAFNHVVVNNGAHDSVGGQPTVAFDIDIVKIAKDSGYKWTCSVDNEADLKTALGDMCTAPKPAFLEIRVAKGNRTDLGRPTLTPIEIRDNFMKKVK